MPWYNSLLLEYTHTPTTVIPSVQGPHTYAADTLKKLLALADCQNEHQLPAFNMPPADAIIFAANESFTSPAEVNPKNPIPLPATAGPVAPPTVAAAP